MKINKLNNKFLRHWRDILAIMTVMLVMGSLVLISYSVGQNNRLTAQDKELAIQNKQFIACIAKDLATPVPASARSRVITNLYTTCNIEFTN